MLLKISGGIPKYPETFWFVPLGEDLGLRLLLDISRILDIDSTTLGWVEWQPCRQAFLPHAISGMISDFVVVFQRVD